MKTRLLLIGIMLLTVGTEQGPAGEGTQKKKGSQEKQVELNDLSLEVTAHQILRQFRFTFTQLDKVRQFTKEAADNGRQRLEARASKEFRGKLQELHKALVLSGDDDLIEQLSDELDDLRYEEKPFLDDEVKPTRAARRYAPELLRMLKVNQYAAFTGLLTDLADPRDLLIASLAKGREVKGMEWRDLRDRIAAEVGRLVGGVNEAKERRLTKAATALLNKAHRLTKQQFDQQLPELEKAAREIVGTITPTQVIRNEIEYSLAELLSNPRLAAVLTVKMQL
jgi:hypothetical protein